MTLNPLRSFALAQGGFQKEASVVAMQPVPHGPLREGTTSGDSTRRQR